MIDIGDFTEMALEDYLSLPPTYTNDLQFIESLAKVYAYKFHTVRNIVSSMALMPVMCTVYPTVYKTGRERISEMWYELICDKLNKTAIQANIKMQFKVDKSKMYDTKLQVKYQPTQLIKRGEFALADVLDI